MPKAKVLVVEDNDVMLNGIRDILKMADYQVLTASNGEQALALLKQHTPDLIVSDIMMPHMDGYQLFAAVRANPKWFTIPFIFLTAKDQRVDVRLGKQLGADDYLTKPFEPADLLIAAEAKLERAAGLQAVADAKMSELKQSILNTLSHEFRTPLTYVQGYLDLILKEGPDTLSVEELSSFLKRVKQGSDRLRNLMDDFIFLVMLETGEALSAFRWEQIYFTNLPKLIETVVQQNTPMAHKRNVRLEIEIQDALPNTVLHADFVRDALGRLVDNAIKFSKDTGGTVRVRAWSDDEWIYIAVEDKGIGIPQDEIPHLFKRFHQINRDLLEQQGIGSGLSIAKGIAELHNGRIKVESQEGQGSTFTLILPIVQDPHEEKA